MSLLSTIVAVVVGHSVSLLKEEKVNVIVLGKSDVAGWGVFVKHVIDAMRNDSSNPNCYAKCIEAGSELFYDYCYEPNHTPTWAQKQDPPKKHQSNL
ncbi:hypothetical protein L1887_21129 [Cichorium endivia]|nr:hypothetical protein L1887_21129 [Cichorium endivia]